jgi:hypothetical protein
MDRPSEHGYAAQWLDERRAEGAGWRQQVPLSAHAEWKVPPDRPDPVEILIGQGKTRIAELLPIRYARMKADPFAFLRGVAAIMAADLASGPTTGLRVQACGDCHLANFGAYATPEGTLVFDVNDFDETLPAPFEWDVKRLVASLVVAGRVIASGAGGRRRFPRSTTEWRFNWRPSSPAPQRRLRPASGEKSGAGYLTRKAPLDPFRTLALDFCTA